ncbi:MAG: hypothetical protein ACYC6N_02170 [Pirellulaceae bacterium]
MLMAKKWFVISVVAAALFASLQIPSLAIGPASATDNPDFTQGDRIPEGADHDWNLGASGARGWMFSDKLVTTDARQIAITEVEKNSPADSVQTHNNESDSNGTVACKVRSYSNRVQVGPGANLGAHDGGASDAA